MNNIIEAYKVYLASNFALYVKTHGAHFNVTGMNFPQLHTLFNSQYEDLWEAHDAIGENIRKLDAFTPAGLKDYAKISLVDDICKCGIGHPNRGFLSKNKGYSGIHGCCGCCRRPVFFKSVEDIELELSACRLNRM